MRSFVSILLVIITTGFVIGQSSIDSLFTAYRTAAASFSLSKNEGNLLPFKELAALKIAHLSLGEQPNRSLDQAMQLYTNVQSCHLPADADGQSAGEVFRLLINYSDVVVVSSADTAVYNQTMQSFLKDLSKRMTVAQVIFGDSTAMLQTPAIDLAKAVLYTPLSDSLAQSLAGQICFDALHVASHTDQFPSRLQYVHPVLAGMDARVLKDSITAIIQQGIEQKAFPGAQVLVAKEGKVVFHQTFGKHTYEGNQPVRWTDLYDLASVTKVTTAIPALMRMQDDGLFDIDAKMGDYFPELKGSNKENLYFRSVLAHQAGLQPYIVFWKKAQRKNGKYRWFTFKNKQSRRFPIPIAANLYLHRKYKTKMMRQIRDSEVASVPEYQYSGLSFLMFPDLIKQKTGLPLDRYLYQNFYHKLGANRLVFNPLKRFPSEEIVPTEADTFFRKQQVHGKVHDEAAAMLEGLSTNAGLFGNANDLAKLLQMLLNGGTYGGERFIEKMTVAEFTRCQFCDQGNRRGLGFDKPLIEYDAAKSYVAKSASRYSYGHSGFTGTFFWVDPAEDLIFILLTNRVYPSRDHRNLYQLNIRPRLHQIAYDAIYAYEKTLKLKEKEADNQGEQQHKTENK